MNKIINRFLLTGDKLIPEMNLKQPRFRYSVCGPFTKNKERVQKFKKQKIQGILIKTNYNPGQNIWHKLKAYSKIGLDYKNLISNSTCLLIAFVKV